jgi:hypothetical protein
MAQVEEPAHDKEANATGNGDNRANGRLRDRKPGEAGELAERALAGEERRYQRQQSVRIRS